MNAVESNERVNAWLLQQFRKADEGYAVGEVKHLRRCPTTRVVACQHEWKCGCYSEYTRDDDWAVAADFTCGHGTTATYHYRSPGWGTLPEIIAAIRDADLESFECFYDEDDDD